MHIHPALKNRSFLLLWLGLMISVAGSQMQVAAIHWHIRDLTGTPDPLALGGIGLARILPVIVFSLFGGAFADTYNRRTILFITQSLMALTALGLADFWRADRTLAHLHVDGHSGPLQLPSTARPASRLCPTWFPPKTCQMPLA
jgi:MFS family permease